MRRELGHDRGTRRRRGARRRAQAQDRTARDHPRPRGSPRGRKCAFPGSEHTLFLDHHHIEHWADGGETKVDNLMLLCRHHHTFVHDHGWTIEPGPSGPTFVAPSGRRMEAAPQLGPVDLVAQQDHLPGRSADHALYATGGWEAVDYPAIIHTLAVATVRGTRQSAATMHDRAPLFLDAASAPGPVTR